MQAWIRRWTVRAVEALLGVAVALLATGAAAQVALRYLFEAPLSWIEPLSILLMIWMAWVGAAYLWLTRRHIAVDLLSSAFPPHWRRRMAVAMDAVAIGVGSTIFAMSFQTFRAFAGMNFGDMDLDITVKYEPIATGALLLALAGALNLWQVAQSGVPE